MVFGRQEKEVFRKILRNLEAFAGVRLVTYCLMDNHFHLLVEVPDREELVPLTEETLLTVLPRLHDAATVDGVRQEFARAREAGNEAWHREILGRYERRRGSLAFFLKDVKQRVTLYINKRRDRTGTLWEGRYKSVLIEGRETALLTVAAYIDLNPVRAGIVATPEAYRWSGYGEAIGENNGANLAKTGLGVVLSEALRETEWRHDWVSTRSRYRLFLYGEGQERDANELTGQSDRRGFCEAAVEAVVAQKGELSVPELLRQRVRYFCDGAVIGTAEFVDEVFAREQACSQRFGKNRTTGARRMRGADWGELRVLRDLRKGVPQGAGPS
jgi:REP element-mobilizing transposase RayT